MGTLDQRSVPSITGSRKGQRRRWAPLPSRGREPPPAIAGGGCACDMSAGRYLFAGSSACLTRNLRMLLMPCRARRVLAGALRTLARSLALRAALETLAPGV
jgi:hypothetical protein